MQNKLTRPVGSHYDDHYFNGHYGRVIAEPEYHDLLARFWRFAIFSRLHGFGDLSGKRILDYGAGTGVVTAALPNTACYDLSGYARAFLRDRGRDVYEVALDIPQASFDGILCSHSLEHYEDPKTVLTSFRNYVRRDGFLILILPIDDDYRATIVPDDNQHLYCWNFQAIANLLYACDWVPRAAAEIYGPFMLRTLGRIAPGLAVQIAHRLGCVKRSFRSMLVFAEVRSP